MSGMGISNFSQFVFFSQKLEVKITDELTHLSSDIETMKEVSTNTVKSILGCAEHGHKYLLTDVLYIIIWFTGRIDT